MGEHAALVKFGEHDHLIQLREEGILYMNTLPHFWEVEDEELRGDPFDSIAEVARGKRADVKLPNGEKLPVEVTDWTLRMHPPYPEKINIFCMYALRPAFGSFPVDEKNFRFGDQALIITDVQQFINRMSLHLKSQGIKGKADLVEYMDDKHIGQVGPFRKRNKFAYQSEWRLVSFEGPGDVRKIVIGNIADISTIMPSKNINESNFVHRGQA